MAKLSKVDAAKAAGVSRQTLYTYIKDHRLSVDADGLIDTAELLRAGFTLRTLHEIGRPIAAPAGQPLTSRMDTVDTLDVYQDMIAMLKQQLSEAQAREQAALERERSARDREALLLQMVEQMQHRYDRLLEAPRSLSAPPESAPLGRSPADTTAPTRVVAPAGTPFPTRGAARQRILALLREYPEGLTGAELRVLLGAEKSLTDTCAGMFKNGLLRRVGRGRYVVAD